MELWYSVLSVLPFEWAQPGQMYFMKHALMAVLVISPLFGILSTMVVHSKMSFFSDALGHSAFTGMAIGALCGFNEPTWAAVIFALVFALLHRQIRTVTNHDLRILLAQNLKSCLIVAQCALIRHSNRHDRCGTIGKQQPQDCAHTGCRIFTKCRNTGGIPGQNNRFSHSTSHRLCRNAYCFVASTGCHNSRCVIDRINTRSFMLHFTQVCMTPFKIKSRKSSPSS